MLKKSRNIGRDHIDKPYKGSIENWSVVRCPGNYIKIYGKPINHPNFADWILTSPVVKRRGNEIETVNSRYTLVGLESEV